MAHLALKDHVWEARSELHKAALPAAVGALASAAAFRPTGLGDPCNAGCFDLRSHGCGQCGYSKLVSILKRSTVTPLLGKNWVQVAHAPGTARRKTFLHWPGVCLSLGSVSGD